MMKFLSLLLSATLIFTSLVPSYAEAASSISQQKARISAQVSDGIEHAVERARVRNGKFAVADKVAEVKGVVKLLREGFDSESGQEGLTYEAFKLAYEKEMKEVLARGLMEAKTEEEKEWVKSFWGGLVSEEGTRAAYKEYTALEEEGLERSEDEGKAYLKQLGREIIAVYKGNRKAGLELITEGLPVFMAAGAIDGDVRQKGAAALRESIKSGQKSCGGVGLISGVKARFGYDGDVKE
uniref:hypothetical protein n=1 Tax=Candidatus Avelusimicrobium aviculae TaxID=3416206 RepID=UPI003D0D7D46